ncbi:MAG: YncE family protein [Candidatus Caldarchaeum sp.]
MKSLVRFYAVVVVLILVGIGVVYSQPAVTKFDVDSRVQFGDISSDGKIVTFASQCFRCPENYNGAFVMDTATDQIKFFTAVRGNNYETAVTGPLQAEDGSTYYMVYSGDFGPDARCPCIIGTYNTKTGDIGKIEIGSHSPQGLEVTTDGKQIYYLDVARASRALRGIDTATGQENYELTFEGFVGWHINLSQDDKIAYVTGFVRQGAVVGVRVVDLAAKQVIASIDTDLGAGDTDFGAAAVRGNTLVVVDGPNNGFQAAVVDLAAGSVKGLVDVGASPAGVAISPDESRAFVGSLDDQNISIIDLKADPPAVVGTIDLKGQNCDVVDLQISPDGNTLYAACMQGNAILKITGF